MRIIVITVVLISLLAGTCFAAPPVITQTDIIFGIPSYLSFSNRDGGIVFFKGTNLSNVSVCKLSSATGAEYPLHLEYVEEETQLGGNIPLLLCFLDTTRGIVPEGTYRFKIGTPTEFTFSPTPIVVSGCAITDFSPAAANHQNSITISIKGRGFKDTDKVFLTDSGNNRFPPTKYEKGRYSSRIRATWAGGVPGGFHWIEVVDANNQRIARSATQFRAFANTMR